MGTAHSSIEYDLTIRFMPERLGMDNKYTLHISVYVCGDV